jgi:predicted Rossmann-fold nucleotide-binding protein
MGTHFWLPMLHFMRETLVEQGTIEKGDLAIFKVTDSPQEAVDYVRDVAMAKFGLTKRERPRRHWFFGERA